MKSIPTEEWLTVSPETPQLENLLELSKYPRREGQITGLSIVLPSLSIYGYLEKPWENTWGQNNQKEKPGANTWGQNNLKGKTMGQCRLFTILFISLLPLRLGPTG